MLDNIFRGIFDAASVSVIGVKEFLLCVGVALVIGGVIALTASRRRFSHSFLAALATLPALSCVIIMMVNGNVGAGVATAGAFSLVRFRSAAGSAREIVLIFLAMAVGIIAGMGYLAYAALFGLLMSLVFLALGSVDPESRGLNKSLRVTVPEDLDYSGLFDGALKEYCTAWTLRQVKTVNMGSLFRLTYDVTLKRDANEKALIDRLRCLNGNLEIALGHAGDPVSEL